MGVFDSIKSRLFPSSAADPNVLWLYVRCARCGTPLAVRVDTRNELSADYEQGGYVLIKEMMDGKCFTLMRAEVHFDQQRNVTEQSVDKGAIITRQEYEAATNTSSQTPTSNA
jgi:hypothetical protein